MGRSVKDDDIRTGIVEPLIRDADLALVFDLILRARRKATAENHTQWIVLSENHFYITNVAPARATDLNAIYAIEVRSADASAEALEPIIDSLDRASFVSGSK